MKLALHIITISLSQMGVYLWQKTADWHSEEWITAYYIWDKLIIFLLALCCILPMKALKPLWIVTGMFFALRLLLEISASIYNIAEFLISFKVMFLINIVCSFIIIKRSTKITKITGN